MPVADFNVDKAPVQEPCPVDLLEDKPVAAVGYFSAFLSVFRERGAEELRQTGTEGKYRASHRRTFAEVGAVPSWPRKGELVIKGIASQKTRGHGAVEEAIHFIKSNHAQLVEHLGAPYIDFSKRVRLVQSGANRGKEMSGKWRDMDIVFCLPPDASLAYMTPSIILAAITMLWGLKSVKDWSAVGQLNDEDLLIPYPSLGEVYLKLAKMWEYKVLLLANDNAKQLNDLLESRADLQEKYKDIKIVPCHTMWDMVKYAILEEPLP